MIDIHFERQDGSTFNLRFKKLNTQAGMHWYVKMVTSQRDIENFQFTGSDQSVFESVVICFGKDGEPLTEEEKRDITTEYKFGYIYVNDDNEMSIDMNIKWHDAEQQPGLLPVAKLTMPYGRDEINYMLVGCTKIIGVYIV